MGADLNGMAVLHACEQIRARLAPIYAAAAGDGSCVHLTSTGGDGMTAPFREVCLEAYKRGIPLGATGFLPRPFGHPVVEQLVRVRRSVRREHVCKTARRARCQCFSRPSAPSPCWDRCRT